MPRYFNDRPIEHIDNDKIWKEDTSIYEEINAIVDVLVAPILDINDSSPSLTFAIFGRWGMGKSSVLRLIKQQAYHKIRQASGDPLRLRFCDYNAPINEALVRDGRADVAMTFALRMMRSLSGDSLEDLSTWLLQVMPLKIRDELLGKRAERSSADYIATLEALQSAAQRFGMLINYDEIFRAQLQGISLNHGDHSMFSDEYASQHETPSLKVLVVCIDDLDRCETQFVRQVLNAIQQWSDIPNVYFIMAVDKEQLRRAFHQNPEAIADADFQMEKYVQHSFLLPDLNKSRIEHFLTGLGEDNDPVLAELKQHANLVSYGLRVQTPRSIKRMINGTYRFIAEFLHNRQMTLDEQETALFIKERLFEYSWPDYYQRLYRPAQLNKRGNVYFAFIGIERAALCLVPLSRPRNSGNK